MVNLLIRTAADFGHLVRERRRYLGLTQDELAARCGVGRRFIVELEAGKPSLQLSKALLAASEVGLELTTSPGGETRPTLGRAV
ncbi:MAG TPA: helix-turn-helix domain-containing protein [Microvirga sp.]|jgi:y4mF family transcriptional regulator|nr:helix-turn-helix domain-containing protein [Microvirga sp.]